ncbi:hypothetical protein [Geoglobus acetivorans]|uniref:DNA double-strand break repair Rad50 ATPase n=1 Tax=Geoglobus acetivorans TaxID=565033 RepID=A0A0A7GHA8_GEOAI|nr:DNA double-strand break repair Rad50 ATPase [Geoglobus acetivorans]
MGFGFFKRKKVEHPTLEEAEVRVLNMISSAERGIETFISEKEAEIRAEIDNLVSALEMFDVDAVHPRLRNQARNFVSAMLTLWRTGPDGGTGDVFLEASKKLEKVASMKAGYFRMLFAVNPQEIEQIDSHLRGIAGIIADVEGKRKEAGIVDLEDALRLIENTKSLTEERNRASRELSELLSEIERVRAEVESEDEEGADGLLANLRAEIEAIGHEINIRENEVHRKIARVKKPIRLYAHAIGVKVNTDTRNLLLNMDDLKSLASGALSEVKKGNIKLKEKKLDTTLRYLEEILNGSLELEVEKVDELKRRLKALESEVRKLESQCERRNPAERQRALERRITSLEETISLLDGEVAKSEESLERVLSVLWDCEVRLQTGKL